MAPVNFSRPFASEPVAEERGFHVMSQYPEGCVPDWIEIRDQGDHLAMKQAQKRGATKHDQVAASSPHRGLVSGQGGETPAA